MRAGAGPDAPADPVHAFFADLGLMWREEGEGRLIRWPTRRRACSTSRAPQPMRARANRAAGRPCASTSLRGRASASMSGSPTGGGARRRRRRGRRGRAAGQLSFLPARLREGRPVLGPLRTDAALVRQLNNIRVRCDVSLVDAEGGLKARERGEVLFRDYGVSGIAVFNLSRFADPGDELRIDLLPQVPFDKAEGFLRARRKRLALAGRPCSGEAVLRGALLPAVAHAALKEAGLRPDAPFGKADAPALARVLKGMALSVHGIGDARQCQVMRGGFETGAFDARTLEAFAAPGLFAAGEALDVDAPCGGYNL
ncbi:MAG: aminoacetone oxidase family FAD-binding enzyme, partial [Eggerthellaceae bacterium]